METLRAVHEIVLIIIDLTFAGVFVAAGVYIVWWLKKQVKEKDDEPK